jgi:hypothetical protein
VLHRRMREKKQIKIITGRGRERILERGREK